jgi:histidinol dehydrogenase
MTIRISRWKDLGPDEQTAALTRPVERDNEEIREQVRSILAAVRQSGDDAVAELTRKFDRVDPGELRVSERELADATNRLEPSALDAIDLAIRNVQSFHRAQVPGTLRVETMPGVVCERRHQPIDAVGLYVPAGSAPLPSAAIMLGVPATIAECPVRVLCTPPRPDGSADAAVLVAAQRAGISDIYKIGGAQAIAAMAYGTATVPKVEKIFGPGNAWVTCAKTLVSSEPGGAAMDMPAGPSEVLVIADAEANAAFVAADLLAQAEHGPDSQVILLTNSRQLADAVKTQTEKQLERLSRAGIAREALTSSRIIVVDDIDTAIDISNRYAPEHLILQVNEPRTCLADIRNAGSVFLGQWSPESVGDYCSGTNHVLPTYGYARAYSGLGVDQFMRSMTIQELSHDGLREIAGAVTALAGLEGLDAHAAAVTQRLESQA